MFRWHGEYCLDPQDNTQYAPQSTNYMYIEYSHARQANSWQQTCRDTSQGRPSTQPAIPKHKPRSRRLHSPAKQLLGQHVAVLSSTAISATASAMESAIAQHCVAANNILAPESLHPGGHDQPIHKSLSYMKSLMIRCVLAKGADARLHFCVSMSEDRSDPLRLWPSPKPVGCCVRTWGCFWIQTPVMMPHDFSFLFFLCQTALFLQELCLGRRAACGLQAWRECYHRREWGGQICFGGSF